MVRKILGAVAGYLTMALFVGLTFAAAFAALGMDGAFRPGSWVPSGTWLVISFVLGFAGAILGGLVCVLIAGGRFPAKVLAAIVAVVGLGMAVPVLMSDAPAEERPAVATAAEAASKARQPAWVALLNPFLGAGGILLGSRLRGEREDQGQRVT